ncbi:hypothetical protein ACFWXK_08065 [Streptomyces sp. NPDC059070]|uniref:hypothetical protein n=1 Tax=Streptomyces sp. NPDC059070 TaxID=3346713 RepID=UPI0036C4AB70
MANQRGKGRSTVAVAALCTLALLQGPGRAGAANGPQPDGPYRYDRLARPVTGAASAQDGPRLTAGSVYRAALGPHAKTYFQVALPGLGEAYVSAVAVPGRDAEVSDGEGIQLSLQDRDGNTCDSSRVAFDPPKYPRPLAAYVTRGLSRSGTPCQAAGTYYVLVERVGDDASAKGDWGIELRHSREPGLAPDEPTAAPTRWPSASPLPPSGGAHELRGGTGFADAPRTPQGVWRDTLRPGETRFFRVPVGWGQQLFATAELGRSGGGGYVPQALDLQLYNPVLGPVADVYTVYDGKPATTSFAPLPPVDYRNRFSPSGMVSAMRLGGDYYLAVSVSPELAAKFGPGAYAVTLRVNVRGQAKAGPSYRQDAPDVTTGATGSPTTGTGAASATGSGSAGMKALAAAGIGTGTLLVLWLGVWTLLARRRALPL